MNLRESKRLIKHLHSIGGGPDVVRKAAARVLNRLSPTDAAEFLTVLIREARQSDEEAMCVLRAVSQALEFEVATIEHVNVLKRVAILQENETVVSLLAEGGARKEYHPSVAEKADSKLFSLPLGHLKTRARLSRNVDELTKLAATSQPSVIQNLLINPRLTEEIVVRIAARRPARPEPLVEIFRSSKWAARPMVRRALAFNPYLPVEIGSKILPLLTNFDLRELARDKGVHEALRRQASEIMAAARAPCTEVNVPATQTN